MRDNTNVKTESFIIIIIIIIIILVVNQSKEDISACKSLMDVAMATKFWPK